MLNCQNNDISFAMHTVLNPAEYLPGLPADRENKPFTIRTEFFIMKIQYCESGESVCLLSTQNAPTAARI